MRPPNPVRLRNLSGFRALWAAEAVSGTGSSISLVVVPIFAVVSLDATPVGMAAIGLAVIVPGLVLSLPMAAIADRSRNHVRHFCRSELGVATATMSIPILWSFGFLSIHTLVVLILVETTLKRLSASHRSHIIVNVVPNDSLVAASGAMAALSSAGSVVGQGLGGIILRFATAPIAFCVDAASTVAGVSLLAGLRKSEAGFKDRQRLNASPTADDGGCCTEPGPPGALAVPRTLRQVANRVLRQPTMLCLAGVAILGAVGETSFVIYAADTLNFSAGSLALFVATGALGGVAGGLLAARMERRFRRWTLVVASLVSASSTIPLVLADAGGLFAIAAVIYFELSGAFGGTVIAATVFGGLQQTTEAADMARTMATAATVLQIGAVLGLLAGGLLATVYGERVALALAPAVLAVGACAYALLISGKRRRAEQ